MMADQNRPTCPGCDDPMLVVRRSITSTGVSRPKTAECQDCVIAWTRGSGFSAEEPMYADGGETA